MFGQQTVIELKDVETTYLELPERFSKPMNIIELPVRKEVSFIERTVQGPQGPQGPVPTIFDYVVITSDVVAEYGKYYIVDLRSAISPITIIAPTNNITDGQFGVSDGFLGASQLDIITQFTLLYGEPGTYTINFDAGGVVFTNTGTTAGWIKDD